MSIPHHVFQSIRTGLKLIWQIAKTVRNTPRLCFLSLGKQIPNVLGRLCPEPQKLPELMLFRLDTLSVLVDDEEVVCFKLRSITAMHG
jgi:hypothetical protein